MLDKTCCYMTPTRSVARLHFEEKLTLVYYKAVLQKILYEICFFVVFLLFILPFSIVLIRSIHI